MPEGSITESKLMSAFETLIKAQDYSSIRITDILEKSGVSRQAFYKRYRDKYDFASRYVCDLLMTIEVLLHDGSTLRDLNLMVLTVVIKNREIFTHFYSSDEGADVTFAAMATVLQKWGACSGSTWASTVINTHILTNWVNSNFEKPVQDVYSEILINMPAHKLLTGEELTLMVEDYSNTRICDSWRSGQQVMKWRSKVRTNESSSDVKLLNTFGEFIDRCPYGDIRVSDILAESGVSRQSFYRRYRDKFDLAVNYVFTMVEAVETFIGDETTTKELICMLLLIFKNHLSVFAHLYADEEGSAVTSAATAMLLQKWDSLPTSTWATSLINERIIATWLNGRCKKKVEDVYYEIAINMPAYALLSKESLNDQIEKYGNKKVKDLYHL